jgi:hypothetical protein
MRRQEFSGLSHRGVETKPHRPVGERPYVSARNEETAMKFSFSSRPKAWWQFLFPAVALIGIVAFMLVPGCDLRWHI